MTKYPFLLTALSAGLFFFFATATSDDDDLVIPLMEYVEVNLTAEIEDSVLILSNQDTLSFSSATLQLYDYTESMPYEGIYWFLNDYSIESGEEDTIFLTEFMDTDSVPFPLDVVVTEFYFQDTIDDFTVFFMRKF